MPSYRLILASTSPRRRQLLADAGFVFEAKDPGDAEDAVHRAVSPEALAVEKARLKARAVALSLSGPRPALIVGADTLVAAGHEVLGKPVDRTDAKSILTRLSGTRHQVISGVCVWPVMANSVRQLAPWTAEVSTWVTMRKVDEAEIDAYVASGESDGKAGAYAIQERGDRFVEKIDGSFANVVGFPIELFRETLPRLLKEWELE